MKILCLVFSLFCGFTMAQKAAPPRAASAPVVVSSEAYPLPLEDHAKFRDLQHQIDQLEIEIQKMQVRIEQAKQQQAFIFEQEQAMLTEFFDAKHLNRDTYEFDPAELKARPKKK